MVDEGESVGREEDDDSHLPAALEHGGSSSLVQAQVNLSTIVDREAAGNGSGPALVTEAVLIVKLPVNEFQDFVSNLTSYFQRQPKTD